MLLNNIYILKKINEQQIVLVYDIIFYWPNSEDDNLKKNNYKSVIIIFIFYLKIYGSVFFLKNYIIISTLRR